MFQGELVRLDLVQTRNEASKCIISNQKLQKVRFNKARAKAKIYNESEFIMILITYYQATCRKLASTFRRLLRVTKAVVNDRYEVEDLRENMKDEKQLSLWIK